MTELTLEQHKEIIINFVVKHETFPNNLETLLVGRDSQEDGKIIGVKGYFDSDMSRLTKWISDNWTQKPTLGTLVWTLDYGHILSDLLASNDISAETKAVITDYDTTGMSQDEGAAHLIDTFVIEPFFSRWRPRLMDVFVLFPVGGCSVYQYFDEIIDLSDV
jgi:hypothetical protein